MKNKKNLNLFERVVESIDDSFPHGIFGWRFTYIIIRPHKMLSEIFLRIKWAFQRVYRGWDDRAVWSVDIWLSEMLPPILRKLKKVKHGVPFMFLPDDVDSGGYENYRMKVGSEMYSAQLELLASGLERISKMEDPIPDNADFKDVMKQRQADFENTMQLFTKLMFTLWD